MFQNSRESQSNNGQSREKYKKPNLLTEAVNQDDYLYVKISPLKEIGWMINPMNVKRHKVSHGFFPLSFLH